MKNVVQTGTEREKIKKINKNPSQISPYGIVIG